MTFLISYSKSISALVRLLSYIVWMLQAKQLDPDFGLDGDGDDGWDDALGYLEACGPGVQHQIARTTSLEQTLASASLASNGSEAAHFLVDNSQRDKVVPPGKHLTLCSWFHNDTAAAVVKPHSASSEVSLL